MAVESRERNFKKVSNFSGHLCLMCKLLMCFARKMCELKREKVCVCVCVCVIAKVRVFVSACVKMGDRNEECVCIFF